MPKHFFTNCSPSNSEVLLSNMHKIKRLEIFVVIILVCDICSKRSWSMVCAWVRKRLGDADVCPCVWCDSLRQHNNKCGSWSLTGWPLFVYTNIHPLLTSWSRNGHAAMVLQKQKRFFGKSTKHLTPTHFKNEAFWRSSVMRSKYRGQGSHTPPTSNVGSFQRHHYCSFNAPLCTFPCYLCTLFCLRFPPFLMNILPYFSGFSLQNNRSRAQGFSAAQHDPDFLVPISGTWWMRCLWRHTATSNSRVNSSVSAKFFDTMHIIIHAFSLVTVV